MLNFYFHFYRHLVFADMCSLVSSSCDGNVYHSFMVLKKSTSQYRFKTPTNPAYPRTNRLCFQIRVRVRLILWCSSDRVVPAKFPYSTTVCVSDSNRRNSAWSNITGYYIHIYFFISPLNVRLV